MFRGWSIVALVTPLVACNAIFGVDDFEVSGAGSAGDQGEIGGEAAGGGMGGTSDGGDGNDAGAGGMAGAGGVGGMPPTIVDRGLVVRYYFDEDASGTPPTHVLDSGQAPELHAEITYDASLAYTTPPTGNGLTWSPGSNGRASVPVDASKLTNSLHGQDEATIEVVMDPVDPMAAAAVILLLTPEGENGGRLGIISFADELAVEINDNNTLIDYNAVFTTTVVGMGRQVLHAVIDTKQAAVEDRIQLFVDGVASAQNTGILFPLVPPSQNETIDLSDANLRLSMGARFEGDREYGGTLYYMAVYNVALTDAERANNLAILTTSDYAPMP